MKKADTTFDVIVVGAGVVGLSAAIAMKKRGYNVALLDAKPLPIHIDRPATTDVDPKHARVYALNQASQQLLTTLDVWPKIQPDDLAPYSKMHVWDASNEAYIDFDACMIGAADLGAIVSDATLKHALYQNILSENIRHVAETTVQHVTTKPDHLTIQDHHGKSWSTQCLIAADGPQSTLRTAFNVDLTTWSYHQDAIVATIHLENAHQNTAYQVFHPEGILACLPLPSSQYASIVWSCSKTYAKSLMSLSELEFSKRVTDTFDNKLGACSLKGQRHVFPLTMRHAKEYCGERWLLMGDAAHTFHPLAGLGLNVGLADLAAWLDVLSKDYGLTHQRTLSTYQRERKHAVWSTITLMQGLKTLFGSQAPGLSTLRGFGLRQCNQLTPLKKLFIQYAIGVDLSVIY